MINNIINLTIVGANYYEGFGVFSLNDSVILIKEPDNIHDEYAIKVQSKDGYTLGYIANRSSYLREESCTNEDIYDCIGDNTKAKIIMISTSYAVCQVDMGEYTERLKNNKEVIYQLEDLKSDRESFLSDDYDSNKIYLKDIEALEKAIKIIRNQEED